MKMGYWLRIKIRTSVTTCLLISRSDVFSWITPELDIKYTNSNSSLPETSGGYGIWGAAVAFPSYFPTGTMNIDGEELPINTPRNLIDLAYPTTIQKE